MLFLAVLVIVLLLVMVCVVRYLLKKHWPERKSVNLNNRLQNISVIENPVANSDYTESDRNRRSIPRKFVIMNSRSRNINNSQSDSANSFGESDYDHRSIECSS